MYETMLPDLPQTEIAIVEMTNAFRKASTLQEVKPNAVLAAAARAFAEYLARTGKFAHEADGREPQERTQAQGYRHCLVAENLAWNLDSRGFEKPQARRRGGGGLEELTRPSREPAAARRDRDRRRRRARARQRSEVHFSAAVRPARSR